MRQRYVCGLMFNPTGGNVVLIRKARPAWQAGKLNGVGGKIEDGEDPLDAMVREFREETGVMTLRPDWSEVAVLEGSQAQVHVYSAFSPLYHHARTKTDEAVEILLTDGLKREELVEHLEWLIPLARAEGLSKPVYLAFEEPF